MIWDVRDHALNRLTRPIMWSMAVESFQLPKSTATVSGLQLSVAANSTNTLLQEIKALIEKLVSVLPSSSSATRRLMQAQFVQAINSNATVSLERIVLASTSTKPTGNFCFDLRVLPAVGSVAELKELTPADAVAAFVSALDAGLMLDRVAFPLLSQVVYVPEADRDSEADLLQYDTGITVSFNQLYSLEDLVQNAAVAESLRSPDHQPPAYQIIPPPSQPVDFNFTASTGSNQGVRVTVSSTLARIDSPSSAPATSSSTSGESPLTAVATVEWQLVPPIVSVPVADEPYWIRWRQLPDIDLDDLDVIGENSNLDVDAWSTSISTRTTETTRIVYQLNGDFHRVRILGLPVQVGGREYLFEVSHQDHTVLFRARTFVVGVPAAPCFISSSQLSPTNLTLQMRQPAFNGLFKPTRATRYQQNGTRFQFTLIDSAAPNARVPIHRFKPLAESASGKEVVGIFIDLSQVNCSLPEPGSARLYTIEVVATTGLASSAVSTMSVLLASVPASMHRLRTRQVTLDSYDVSTHVPWSNGSDILFYRSGYTFQHRQAIHFNPLAQSNSTLRFISSRTSPTGQRLCIRVLFPEPHASFPNPNEELDGPFIQLSVFLVACNRIGCSEPILHRVFPVFIGAARLSQAVQLQVQPPHVGLTSASQAVLLSWRAPLDCSDWSLFTGYVLQFSQFDALLGREVRVLKQLDPSTNAYNLTRLSLSHPVRVDLYASMNHSNNYWQQKRGQHPIYSRPASFIMTLRRPVAGPTIVSAKQIDQDKIQLILQPVANSSNEVVTYSVGLRCAAPSSVWNGEALWSSNSTSQNGTIIAYLNSLPIVAVGSLLQMTVSVNAESLAGMASSDINVLLLGRPFAPLLLNITQTSLTNGNATFELLIQLPRLQTADWLFVRLARETAISTDPTTVLCDRRIALTATTTPLRSNQTVVRITCDHVPVVLPFDQFQLTANLLNLAGSSVPRSYQLRVYNPAPPPRFPRNCCGYQFRDPAVPSFLLPNNPATTWLNKGNELVRVVQQSTSAWSFILVAASWIDECDTVRVEYFDEIATAWIAQIRIPQEHEESKVISLSSILSFSVDRQLRFKASNEQLSVLRTLTNHLFRMSMRCSRSLEEACFQFSFQADVIDAELAKQTPQNCSSIPSIASVGAHINFTLTTLSNATGTSSESASLSIDRGTILSWPRNSSSDATRCVDANQAALWAASAPQWSLPTTTIRLSTIFLADEPLHAASTLPWEDDSRTVGPCFTSSNQPGVPKLSDGSLDIPLPNAAQTVDASSDSAGRTPTATDPDTAVDKSTSNIIPKSDSDVGLIESLLSSSTASVASMSSSAGVQSSFIAPSLPAAEVEIDALVCHVVLRQLAAELLVDAYVVHFLQLFREELAAELRVPAARLRVLAAKRSPVPARSKSAHHVTRSTTKSVEDSSNSSESSAASTSASSSAADLTVAIEPSATIALSSSSSALSLYSTLRASSTMLPQRSLTTTLRFVTSIGDSMVLPLQTCANGDSHVTCQSEVDLQWSEGAITDQSGLSLTDNIVPNATLREDSTMSRYITTALLLNALVCCFILVYLSIKIVPKLHHCFQNSARRINKVRDLPPGPRSLKLESDSGASWSDLIPTASSVNVHTHRAHARKTIIIPVSRTAHRAGLVQGSADAARRNSPSGLGSSEFDMPSTVPQPQIEDIQQAMQPAIMLERK